MRHRITEEIRKSGYGSLEDAMWEILLHDGSTAAELDYGKMPLPKTTNRRERRN